MGLGLLGQPPSAAHASHSPNVTSNFPTAYDRAIATVCCGPSSLLRPASFGGDPIIKLPAGATTIPGQYGHGRPSASRSRKLAPEPGLTDSAGSRRASSPASATDCDRNKQGKSTKTIRTTMDVSNVPSSSHHSSLGREWHWADDFGVAPRVCLAAGPTYPPLVPQEDSQVGASDTPAIGWRVAGAVNGHLPCSDLSIPLEGLKVTS